jgi:hypothetical protein
MGLAFRLLKATSYQSNTDRWGKLMKRQPADFAPLVSLLPEHLNPLREVFVRLPLLSTSADGTLDVDSSSPLLVLELAEHAEDTVHALNLGLAAIGNLWALASESIDDGTVPMGCVESLGWMIQMLSDLCASLMVLAVQCRQVNQQPVRK